MSTTVGDVPFNAAKFLTYVSDSSVSKRNSKDVVTTAAYLLFYRRRTGHPLGPPYLQELVHDARAPPAAEVPNSESNASSRAGSQSPSGKGSRLGGSSQDGSSNASVAAAAAAARQRHVGAGSGGGTRARSASMTREESEIGAQPPVYEAGFDDALDLDDYDEHPSAGPLGWDRPGWNFMSLASMDAGAADEVADNNTASDAAANGSQLGEELQNRLMEDFGDDHDVDSNALQHHGGLAPGQVSPDLRGLADHDDEGLPNLVEAALDVDQSSGSNEEEPVVEVRVDEKDDIKQD